MGRWVVEVQVASGEWYPLQGDYLTPPPDKGGRPEDVIREERDAAEKAGVTWDCPMRAYWEEE